MLLLSKKSFEKGRKNGIKTNENRISLTRWKKKKKIEFCCCRNRRLFCFVEFPLFVWLQPISTIQPIQSRGSFIQFDKCEKSHFSFFHSRISPIVANKQISNLFPHFSFSTILKSKRRNKTKQIQNILCKCGWDFDHFDQFDQNHAFSNHNPKRKRMTIGFVLRELLTIIKHCKNEKQNEWSWNFISFLVCFHHCRKEKKRLSSSFSSFNKQLPFILTHSISSNQLQSITIKPQWEWEEEKVKMNIINNHRTNRNPIV